MHYIHSGGKKGTKCWTNIKAMVMEGVWSSHPEAALPILGLGSILTRQYLRAAKAWQVHGKGRGREVNLSPLEGQPHKTKFLTTKSEFVTQLQPLTSRSVYG